MYGLFDSEAPFEGQRVRVRGISLERYPHFRIPGGAVGTVVSAGEGDWWVQMDDPISGAEEWDNEVHVGEGQRFWDEFERV